MSRVLTGSSKKKDAEAILKQKPILVLFYMVGCPHCESNKPAWDDAKSQVGKEIKVVEIESSATPESSGVTGFPTMMYIGKDGMKETINGEKSSGEEILKELKVPKKKKAGTRRRRMSRRKTRRNYSGV